MLLLHAFFMKSSAGGAWDMRWRRRANCMHVRAAAAYKV